MTVAVASNLNGLLQRTALFTAEQIQALLLKNAQTHLGVTATVVSEGLASEAVFLAALGKALGLQFRELDATTIETAVLEKLPTKAVFQHNVLPVAIENGVLLVAASDPFSPGLTDSLRLASGMRVRLVLAASADIARTAKKRYGVGAETVEQLMQDNRIEVEDDSVKFKTDLNEDDQEASIVKFVNQIIWEAYQERATDIHFEPMENELRIRYRIDGVLHATPLPPQLTRFQAAILSRIKVMANMDIAEKRLPQDGRIGLRIRGEDIDIRVSTMPTVYGESVSLRLLLRGKEHIGLEQLGFNPRDKGLIEKMIRRPNGIILVTGPTGSGKSTSLYAFLHEINSVEDRIITVEDPIEYEMAGINQIHVRQEIGLTFATALRHILRQDPDIIMVGEIRDFETAEMAIRASLTGHLVLSTLHTNDSAGAVTRLIDMGVEPFLVASSLEGIIAQRLVRRLCPACRKPVPLDETLATELQVSPEARLNARIFEANGCEKCRNTGFRGRFGIFEVLAVNDTIEPLIVSRASTTALKQKALSQGMKTLREDGWAKVLEGTTTVEEVLRVTEESE
jgi:general secretion pathway protein E/type IV pilus assembly protein PilB